MRSRFARAIGRHRLRREIIATATTNSLVNRMGPSFVSRAQEDTGASPARIARTYTAAREVFEMRELWSQIEALDNRIPAPLQYTMLYEAGRLLRHLTYWLLQHRPGLSINAAVGELRGPIRGLTARLAGTLAGQWRGTYEAVLARYAGAGVPQLLARRMALLDALNCALDLVEIAVAGKVPIIAAAQVYFALGARLGLDWFHSQVDALRTTSRSGGASRKPTSPLSTTGCQCTTKSRRTPSPMPSVTKPLLWRNRTSSRMRFCDLFAERFAPRPRRDAADLNLDGRIRRTGPAVLGRSPSDG